MLKATYTACSFLALAAAASAKSHTQCGMCPAGKAMKANAKTLKTMACLVRVLLLDCRTGAFLTLD